MLSTVTNNTTFATNVTRDKSGELLFAGQSLKALAEQNGYDFFDFAAVLGKPDDPSAPAYGGHPNAQGCEAVAKAFIETGLLEKHLQENKQ